MTEDQSKTHPLQARLIVVAGKGGTGRTTVSAALATLLARQGLRVLLAQTRSRDRLQQLLGGPYIGPELEQVREGLWAVNMHPDNALREYGIMVLRSRQLTRLIIENRLVSSFIRGRPRGRHRETPGRAA